MHRRKSRNAIPTYVDFEKSAAEGWRLEAGNAPGLSVAGVRPTIVLLVVFAAVGCSPAAEKSKSAPSDAPNLALANQGKVLAFPGAEGAGRFATGGRGGTVVHVTNLNAKGPGSLAAAVDGPNRFVVFDVSGVIDLTQRNKKEPTGGKLEIAHPNITIAGQTAPGDGICLTGGQLDITASNVVVRYIRSRRGWISHGESGDSIEVKPIVLGERQAPGGQSQTAFDKRVDKKAERGKIIPEFAALSDIVIDHCSTSWATDENLSVTHADRTTVGWCIAAEGCDYANPKQTPPNHSEGGLWGSEAPNGRATLHHTLYAHNRLRNPRTTGGDDVPAVLNFYNNVVYNWLEHASHTGSEVVHLNWLNNMYRPGANTPTERRSVIFEFDGDPGARIFLSGNHVEGSPEATADNRLGVGVHKRIERSQPNSRDVMVVTTPFADAPAELQTAGESYAAVLDDAGATLPARDPIDRRILETVRSGTGRIIEKEIDLPEAERRLDYRSLDAPKDSDGDGMPDYWEHQFGLARNDPGDAMKFAADGYANIEHYCNSTDPTGEGKPVVYASGIVTRGSQERPCRWRLYRTGDVSRRLAVRVGIQFKQARDEMASESHDVEFATGSPTAELSTSWLPSKLRSGEIVLTIQRMPELGYVVGCPYQALVVEP